MIHTTRGELDEALLMKRDDQFDNEHEMTTTVEYCLVDCPGVAHRTGEPDAPSHFCDLHVHRSAAVVLKQGVAAEGAFGAFS